LKINPHFFDKLKADKSGKNTGFDALLRMRHTNVIQTNFPEELIAYLKLRGLHR
jgi:hypothetical protein